VKTWKLTYDEPDRYGRKRVRTVNRIIDIADFKDRAGFAYLLMAANPHLTVRDTQAVLANIGEQHERPAGWISRRRWLFHGKGKRGAKQNADGLDGKARQIMAEHPRLSCRQMVYLLRKHGIPRSAEWVRENRVPNDVSD
jgi:hypothetical protein